MAWARWLRRHGWQLPLHPLQLVGMAVFAALVAAFYVVLGLGPYIGSTVAGNTLLALFSFSVRTRRHPPLPLSISDRVRRFWHLALRFCSRDRSWSLPTRPPFS